MLNLTCAVCSAYHDLDIHGFAIDITSHEMPPELIAEANFTLSGVNYVKCFINWMSETIVKLGLQCVVSKLPIACGVGLAQQPEY